MIHSDLPSEVDVVLIIRRKDGTEVTAAHVPRAHVMVENEVSYWPDLSTLTRFTLVTRSKWTMYAPEFFRQPQEIERGN